MKALKEEVKEVEDESERTKEGIMKEDCCGDVILVNRNQKQTARNKEMDQELRQAGDFQMTRKTCTFSKSQLIRDPARVVLFGT